MRWLAPKKDHETRVRLWGYFVLSLFVSNGPAYADFTGSVVSVLDGDTIEVLHNRHPERTA